MGKGVTMKTATVVKALRAERRVWERMQDSEAMRERAIGAMSAIKELAYQMGLMEEFNAPIGTYEEQEDERS